MSKLKTYTVTTTLVDGPGTEAARARAAQEGRREGAPPPRRLVISRDEETKLITHCEE